MPASQSGMLAAAARPAAPAGCAGYLTPSCRALPLLCSAAVGDSDGRDAAAGQAEDAQGPGGVPAGVCACVG